MHTAAIAPFSDAYCGQHRSCDTTTPVDSNITDLKGQLDSLQLHPFTNKTFFTLNVKAAYASVSLHFTHTHSSCHRWCVTGTPVGSDISDLKGQLDFLQLHPFTNKTFFTLNVKAAYTGNSFGRPPATALLYTLGKCMIRHTKLQVMTVVFTPLDSLPT